jgi:ParB family transcriptional regulator, chromosome partitioning protein
MTTTAEKVAEAVAADPALDKDKVGDKRRALGRGLEALLPGGPRAVMPQPGPPPTGEAAPGMVQASVHSPSAHTLPATAVVQLELDRIDENPYQTRGVFDRASLEELAESIQANGVVQPIAVRPSGNGRYLLILGERRCRASKLAGKTTIPAIIQRVSEQQAAEMTIVENLQRQDLNCLEQAHAFARLSREFGLTQEQIGQRTGVSRESVSNYMRLLKLPPLVHEYLASGELGFSEARVLLQLPNEVRMKDVAELAVKKKWSVAQLIEYLDMSNLPPQAAPTAREERVDPNVRAAQTELERALGVRVRITDRKGKGKIVIQYSSLEDFDRVLDLLKGKA